ncbi:hypothetical protein Sango_2139300 [Sesamum angolense]|uniref:Uncharacterized protein n=1 Tax=Sesamum angolense TaxID=2727404 RepID=A0AAE1WCB4_9LAMI|nr:hypothetical protein Sango_2139300 [Sesamum angolense]
MASSTGIYHPRLTVRRNKGHGRRRTAARAARRWCALVCRSHGGVLTARRTAPQRRAEQRGGAAERGGAEQQRRGRRRIAPEAVRSSAWSGAAPAARGKGGVVAAAGEGGRDLAFYMNKADICAFSMAEKLTYLHNTVSPNYSVKARVVTLEVMDAHLLAHSIALCIVDVHVSYMSYVMLWSVMTSRPCLSMRHLLLCAVGTRGAAFINTYSIFKTWEYVNSTLIQLVNNAMSWLFWNLWPLAFESDFSRILSRTKCNIELTAIPSACLKIRGNRTMAKLSTQLKEGTENREVGLC